MAKNIDVWRKIPYNNKLINHGKKTEGNLKSNDPNHPREVAAEAMVQILAEGAYNNTALRRLLRQNGAMSQQDRAFVTEIVNGTLRNIYYVDYVIDQFSNTKLNKIKPWLLAVLRTAVYQMLFMDVPDNAAVMKR